MAHYSFTATSLNDLFNQYKANMISEGWFVAKDDSTTSSSLNERELIFSSPTGAELTYIGLFITTPRSTYSVNGYSKTIDDIDDSTIRCNAARTWDLGSSFDTQSELTPYFNTRTSSKRAQIKNNVNLSVELNITNERVLMSVIESDFAFATIFSGRYKPYGDNLQQPHTYFTEVYDNISDSGRFYLENSFTSNYDKITDRDFFRVDIRKNDDSSITLFEDIVYDDTEGFAYGRVDGLFYLTSDRVQSKQTFTIGVDDYIVLPLTYSPSLETKRFYSVKTS